MTAAQSVKVKISGIKAIRVVPFGHEDAITKKEGEIVEVRKEDAKHLIALKRAVAVEESEKKADKK